MADMNSLHRNMVLTSLVIGMAVASAACNQRSPSTTSQNMTTPPSSTSSESSSPPKTAMAPTTPGPSSNQPAPTTSNQMSSAVDDASITAQVKTAIMAEPSLKSTKINVDTKDGTVTLTGTVSSAPLKDKAKEIASNVAGVKSVQDNLTTSQSG